MEEKGIFYYINGDREMGDFKDGEKIGQHAKFIKNWGVKIISY